MARSTGARKRLPVFPGSCGTCWNNPKNWRDYVSPSFCIQNDPASHQFPDRSFVTKAPDCSVGVLGMFGHYGGDMQSLRARIHAENLHRPWFARLSVTSDIVTTICLGLDPRERILQFDSGVEVRSRKNLAIPAMLGHAGTTVSYTEAGHNHVKMHHLTEGQVRLVTRGTPVVFVHTHYRATKHQKSWHTELDDWSLVTTEKYGTAMADGGLDGFCVVRVAPAKAGDQERYVRIRNADLRPSEADGMLSPSDPAAWARLATVHVFAETLSCVSSSRPGPRGGLAAALAAAEALLAEVDAAPAFTCPILGAVSKTMQEWRADDRTQDQQDALIQLMIQDDFAYLPYEKAFCGAVVCIDFFAQFWDRSPDDPAKIRKFVPRGTVGRICSSTNDKYTCVKFQEDLDASGACHAPTFRFVDTEQLKNGMMSRRLEHWFESSEHEVWFIVQQGEMDNLDTESEAECRAFLEGMAALCDFVRGTHARRIAYRGGVSRHALACEGPRGTGQFCFKVVGVHNFRRAEGDHELAQNFVAFADTLAQVLGAAEVHNDSYSTRRIARALTVLEESKGLLGEYSSELALDHLAQGLRRLCGS